jgi:DNA-3-methyladenine glycosylase II
MRWVAMKVVKTPKSKTAALTVAKPGGKAKARSKQARLKQARLKQARLKQARLKQASSKSASSKSAQLSKPVQVKRLSGKAKLPPKSQSVREGGATPSAAPTRPKSNKSATRVASSTGDARASLSTASHRIIELETDIAEGVAALRRKCPLMRKAHAMAGDPPIRRRAAGFEGLARIIVAQQLSVASANAIWARFEAVVVPMQAATLLCFSDDQLRGAGLSGPKIKTLRAISQAVVDGLDLENLGALDNAAVHAALTAVSGIGPWTADIFLMFNLGRADAFAEGDLALQVAAQMLLQLEERPKADALTVLAERWRPWRGVAARLLWAYYAVAKAQKSGATPV